MNKLIRPFLAVAALAAGVALQAEPAVKLLVVDMAKVLDNHYKTEEVTAKLNADAQKVQEQLNDYKKQIDDLGEQAKALIEQSKNTILTPENRGKAEQDAQKKIQEYQQRQAEAQNFSVNNQRSLQQRMKNYRDLIFEEITKTVKDMAKARGATLVLDKSGLTIIGIPAVVYADAGFDITDDVLKEVNKDRPAPAAAPAATTPAPAAAPATAPGTAPAQFTVPNVTKKP
jgi:outer membrane protein